MDPGASRFMWSVLKGLTATDKKACIVLTTHFMEEVEALSSKLGIMIEGGIFSCFGTQEEIKERFGLGYEVRIKLNSSTDLISDRTDTLESHLQGSMQDKKITLRDKDNLTSYILQSTCISSPKDQI